MASQIIIVTYSRTCERKELESGGVGGVGDVGEIVGRGGCCGGVFGLGWIVGRGEKKEKKKERKKETYRIRMGIGVFMSSGVFAVVRLFKRC